MNNERARGFRSGVSLPILPPHLIQEARAMGAEVIGSTPAELDAFRRAEIAKWTRVAKANKIALD